MSKRGAPELRREDSSLSKVRALAVCVSAALYGAGGGGGGVHGGATAYSGFMMGGGGGGGRNRSGMLPRHVASSVFACA